MHYFILIIRTTCNFGRIYNFHLQIQKVQMREDYRVRMWEIQDLNANICQNRL